MMVGEVQSDAGGLHLTSLLSFCLPFFWYLCALLPVLIFDVIDAVVRLQLGKDRAPDLLEAFFYTWK